MLTKLAVYLWERYADEEEISKKSVIPCHKHVLTNQTILIHLVFEIEYEVISFDKTKKMQGRAIVGRELGNRKEKEKRKPTRRQKL